VFDANLHCLLTLKRLQKQQLVEYADKVQGSIARRDKKDTAFEIMKTLSDDVPAFEFYKEMFPTTEMKVTLVSFYIQTLDLLWRLAKYSSLGFLGIFLHRYDEEMANYLQPNLEMLCFLVRSTPL
jgi:hypothetical protein